MSTIKNEHLLSVYVPEIGTPQSLSIIYPTNLTPEILSTGFIDCNTTSTGNIDDGGVESPISGAVGVGLTLSVRITDGEVTNIENIFNRGTGYTLNEIVEIEYQVDGGANKAKVIVNQVDEDGIVLDVTIIDNGESYSIESGVIDTLQLTNDDGDLIDLNIEISNSDFSRVEVISNPNIIPIAFATVGDNLNVVDSLGNVYCEVTVNTISEKISGGIHKYSGEKFVEDVKEIIANEKPPLVTENVDYNSRDSFDPQGDISYDEVEGKLTFHRTAPFNRVLTDDFYIHRDGDTVGGTYNFVDELVDDNNPTEIINIGNIDGETLKINSSGVVNQPNVNVPVEDGDLINKKYIDDLNLGSQDQIDNLQNNQDIIQELLEFDAFGTIYDVNVVSSPPADIEDGNIYLLTSESGTERREGDQQQRIHEYTNISRVVISKNDKDGNEIYPDFTIFGLNSELTINQLQIEQSGGIGRYLVKSEADILTDGAAFDVDPFRVSLVLVGEVADIDEDGNIGNFSEAEASVLFRVSAVVTYDTNEFVRKKGGDTMEGPLRVTGGRSPDADGIVSTVTALNIDSGEDSSLEIKWNNQTRVNVGDDEVSFQEHVKINTGRQIFSGDKDNKKGLVFNDNGVEYVGDYTVDEHVATKKNLDIVEERLHQDIIELEEEIDALAPSTLRGYYRSTSRNAPRSGEFLLGTLTGRVTDFDDQDIVIVQISKEDVDGVTSSFIDVEEGQLIQFFRDGVEDYGLYLIEGISGADDPNIDIVTFTVTFVSGFGEATENELARLKIFSPPEGGIADGFVLKTGDTMSGPLTLEDTEVKFTNHSDGQTMIRAERNEGEYPMLLDLTSPIGTTVDGGYDINIKGNTAHNALRFVGDDTYMTIYGGGTAPQKVKFDTEVSMEYNKIVKLAEATDNDDAVPYGQVKDYVDEKLDNLNLNPDSKCININGGKLCAGDPPPKFIDALNSSAIKYNTLNQLTTHTDNNWRYLRTFDDDNEMYRVLYSNNNRTKAVYRVNYVNNTATFVRNFSDYSFQHADYQQIVDIIMGTVSHDKKYAIAGSQWGGYGGGNDSKKFQYVYEIDLTNTSTTSTEAVTVASGYSSYYKAHSVICTGPKPDSPSGYMIGAFYHAGTRSGTYYYDHTVVVYKFGAGNGNVKTFYTSSQSYWNNNAAPNVYRGNPDHEEFLVTSTSGSKKTIYKVTFSVTVNNTTLQELISASKLPEAILSITYLPRSKRYYLGGVNKGYLTRPYDGPLDDTCFDDAIIVDIPKYTVQWNGATSDFKRYYYYNQPFEFNNEIVLIGANARQRLTSPDDGTKAYLRAPQPIMIYDGGDQWKIYESTAPPADAYNALDENAAAWNDVPRDFPWEKRFDDNYIRRNKVVDSPSQHYGTQNIRLQEDVVIETPGFPQPYTQPLYWNGAQIS